MDSRQLRREFTAAMLMAGFASHPPTWHWPTAELIWCVELDYSRIGSMHSIRIGIWPVAFDPTFAWRPSIDGSPGDGRYPRVGDCPVSISYEGLAGVASIRPIGARSDPRFTDHPAYFAMVMDLGRGQLSESERHDAVINLANGLTKLPVDIPDLAEFRRRFENGYFNAAFIHKDLRAWIEDP